jgi:hypothetical protein
MRYFYPPLAFLQSLANLGTLGKLGEVPAEAL